MAHVNSVLSKELHVKPLVKGQVAVYRLIDSDKDDLAVTDLAGKHRKRTPGHQIAGRKDIYDAIAGATVTIENVSRDVKIKTPFGEISKSRPMPIRFTSDKPAITVRHDEPELYAFMERLDENLDNPYRNTNGRKKAIFYRVDPRKKVLKENEMREFRLDAMNWVMREASYTELRGCAEKINKLRADLNIRSDYKDDQASTGFEMLKRELSALAESDPYTIVKCSTKEELIVKLQIKDCVKFNLIIFDEKNRIWYHNDKTLVKICVVEPLKNIEEALINFFMKDKDGGPQYVKMSQGLAIFLAPR